MIETNNKNLQAKKNHHHVWANYMKRWSPDNLQVYYTTKKNKDIRFDSVKNIAVERDFYRVQALTSEHIQVIKRWSSFSPKNLHKLHMSYLSGFIKMQSFEAIYKQYGRKDVLADKIIEAFKSNGLEEYHTTHENEVQGTLEALANMDLSVLEQETNMIHFMQFLGQQIARTKNFKDTVNNGVVSCKTDLNNPTQDHVTKLTQECWWFIAYMLGMNIGRSLYLDRKQDIHCLLVNTTDTPFITSDQPIINVHTALTEEIKLSEDHVCDFYYPISPNVAYMINKSNRFPQGKVSVSVDVVEEMNIKIAKRANFHIIGNSEESLKPYRKYVGLHLKAVKALIPLKIDN